MPAYEEILPKKRFVILFLTLAFLVIYSPFQLNNWELRRREDRYAAIAYEMDLTHPNTIVHGEQMPFHYPLYPWLAALLFKTGMGFEFCMRIVSVISLAAISILVWETGKRAVGVQTATVAAAMMFSSLIIVEKSMDGYPHLTALLFLFAAWLSWFTYGVARGEWNKAWIVSFFFCGMGFYTLGWTAIIYFLFPLIFMRRPMTVWSKLKKPGFIAGILILLAFMFIWAAPRWYTSTDVPLYLMPDLSIDWKDYLKHLIYFPLELFFRFMPWSLIAWPVFCVAYFPLDKNPIFSRFLRTIVISLFFLLWFKPFINSRDIIFLAPPLSVLCGINYWLLVRRHGRQLHGVMKVLSYASAGLGIAIIFFYTTSFPWSLNLTFIPENLSFKTTCKWVGIIQATAAVVVAISAITMVKKKLNVCMHLLLICVSFSLCFWAVNIPYRSQKQMKKRFGIALASALKKDMGLTEKEDFPEDLTVYIGPAIRGLYVPCLYMKTRVRKIHSLDEFPVQENPVYVLATKYPVSSKRSWEYVTPKDIINAEQNPYIYRNTRFYIFKGTKLKTKKNRHET